MPTYATSPAAASEVEALDRAAAIDFMAAFTARTTSGVSAMILFSAFAATLDADFAAFEAKHGRRYASEAEREYRRAAFAENAAFVAAHNSVSSAPYTLALNHWADRTAAELGLRPPCGPPSG